MDLDMHFPALGDLRARAQRRIPHFAWEYLDSGTGAELGMARARAALDDVILRPAILNGGGAPDLHVTLFGQRYSHPFGIAPVGMSGLFWPNAEKTLAAMAAQRALPYCLSTVAAQGPEDMAPMIGDRAWFQLYPPSDAAHCDDLIDRAQAAGFAALVLTVDVPAPSRRERQRRGGVSTPPKITPRILAHAAMRPAWAMGIMRHGMPKLRGLARYPAAPKRAGEVGNSSHRAPDWDDLARIRARWRGPLIAKGVLDSGAALALLNAGVDAIWVSNHGGRQFDGGPAPADALRDIRAAVGPSVPLIYDGAVGSGLDVLRAIAVGADMVMLGRAWHHGLAAFGARGAAHVAHILSEDMRANMAQMGINRPDQARARLVTG